MIGHNQPSLDSVVEENLLRGLYLSHLNALVSCIEDMRLSQRHRLVLAQIVQRTNAKTGLAYPGRARLASDIVFYANGETKRYSERTIGTTISELIEFGYLVADKRAPESGRRALSHYAITKPSVEELQRKIAEACEAIRNQARRTFSPNSPDDNPGVAVKEVTETSADDNPRVAVRSPGTPDDNPPVVDNPGVDDNPVGVSDDNPVGATVTGKRTGNKIAPKKGASTTRGSRLPADWVLPEDFRTWTLSEFRVSPHKVQFEADKFRDYWHAKAGSGATKVDWAATWRGWCRRAFEKLAIPTGSQAASAAPDQEREAYYAQLRAAERLDP